jgi:hypothetical protein
VSATYSATDAFWEAKYQDAMRELAELKAAKTLRDEFAIAALMSPGSAGGTYSRIAEDAYKQADAMLAAREAKP